MALTMLGGQKYLNSYFQFQNYKDVRKNSKAEKKSKAPTSSSSPTTANSKYAKFFREKNVTEHGIFPLPEKRKIVPVRRSDSGNLMNINLREAQFIANEMFFKAPIIIYLNFP